MRRQSLTFAVGLSQLLRLQCAHCATDVPKPPAPKYRQLSRLKTILSREMYEESIKEDLPPKPRPPRGWTVNHKSGTNYFTLLKTVHIEGSNPELLTIVCQLENKVPDVTYHPGTGERAEQQHLVFTLFVQRVDGDKHRGGLELILTSIESELVLDGFAVHSRADDLQAAMSRRFMPPHSHGCQNISTDNKHTRYRGPYMNELDESLTDEIFDFLDDRGINNAFAEFVMAQGHYIEQEEYLHWLKLLKVFSEAPKIK